MYKVNMHITPAKVRSKICELLEQEHMELVHLAHKFMEGDDNRWFVLIAKDEKSSRYREHYSYSVHTFDSATNLFNTEEFDITYPHALIMMAKNIEIE